MAFDEATERAYLTAGMQPGWTRVWREGCDITDSPALWTPEERAMREDWLVRLARYQQTNLT